MTAVCVIVGGIVLCLCAQAVALWVENENKGKR